MQIDRADIYEQTDGSLWVALAPKWSVVNHGGLVMAHKVAADPPTGITAGDVLDVVEPCCDVHADVLTTVGRVRVVEVLPVAAAPADPVPHPGVLVFGSGFVECSLRGRWHRLTLPAATPGGVALRVEWQVHEAIGGDE